uniref:Putative secreted protein n=1 Tax=Ixodes ricinus TaxID=34613 RepID=A0A6B0U6E0_IXORI
MNYRDHLARRQPLLLVFGVAAFSKPPGGQARKSVCRQQAGTRHKKYAAAIFSFLNVLPCTFELPPKKVDIKRLAKQCSRA